MSETSDAMKLGQERTRDKFWDKHSDTNEAVEPESRRTLASAVEPSGAWTMIHVISTDLDEAPAAVLDDTDSEGGLEERGLDSFLSSQSMWSKV